MLGQGHEEAGSYFKEALATRPLYAHARRLSLTVVLSFNYESDPDCLPRSSLCKDLSYCR